MAAAIHIPRLGWNMDEGIFAGWLKADGDAVRAGEPLFRLEAEKATQEIEAAEDGTLRIAPDAPEVGDTVPVGLVIGHLLSDGEPAPAATPRPIAEAAVATVVAPTNDALRRVARDRPRSSPLARRIAQELGIDWTTLDGTGRGGRIRKADILAAHSRAEAQPTRARSVPVGAIRRTIAERMVASRRDTAPVTLTTTVDASNLVNLRGQFRAAEPDRDDMPSYTDFVVKLTALALKDHPLLHSRWEGDRLVFPDEPAIGVAVDNQAGLLVPVLRGAAGLGLREVAARSRDLIRRAREGSLQAADLQGGTFTITNLGAFGIESFTPIINPPESAILGLGRIARRPAMDGERVVGREQLTLSLTFDHRVVDGAPAARFLQALGRMIENPGPYLLR